MLRLLALLVLIGLIGGGYYYWKTNPGASPPRSLQQAQQQLKDVALTGAVKTALSLHNSLKPYAVSVSTEDAVVTLRGEGPSAQLAAAVERVAAAVPEVRQVVNHMEVDPSVAARSASSGDERSLGERLDDEALEVQVRMAYALDRDLKGSRIEVESWKKEIRLAGTVRSAEARRLAVHTASDVTGVRGVSERLTVAGQDSAAEERRAAVEKAIRANANLKDAAISVRLDQGEVVLEGRVTNGAARDLAALLARDAAGRGVRNALEILR